MILICVYSHHHASSLAEGKVSFFSFFLLLLLVCNLDEVIFPVCWTVATNFVVISLFAGTRGVGCSMCAWRVSWVETLLQLNEERTVVGYCGKTAWALSTQGFSIPATLLIAVRVKGPLTMPHGKFQFYIEVECPAGSKHSTARIAQNFSIISRDRDAWSSMKPWFQEARVTGNIAPLPLADAVVLFQGGSRQKRHFLIGSGWFPLTLWVVTHRDITVSDITYQCTGMSHHFLTLGAQHGKKTKQLFVWSLSSFHDTQQFSWQIQLWAHSVCTALVSSRFPDLLGGPLMILIVGQVGTDRFVATGNSVEMWIDKHSRRFSVSSGTCVEVLHAAAYWLLLH